MGARVWRYLSLVLLSIITITVAVIVPGWQCVEGEQFNSFPIAVEVTLVGDLYLAGVAVIRWSR